MAESTIITPDTYTRWRKSTLGRVTEALERKLIFELAGPLVGQRVLDVGTGDGAYSIEAATRQARVVVGVDASAVMLNAAARHAQQRGVQVELREGRAQCLPFDDGAFDIVIAVTVLCFVPDAAQAVREMRRVLAPRGRLLLGELGRWSTWAATRRVRAWMGNRVWRAARFWSRRELTTLVQQAGLRVDEVRGAIFHPPWGFMAEAMAPLDPVLGRIGTPGAAFLAVAARKAGLPVTARAAVQAESPTATTFASRSNCQR
jgi:ubiquinone/menaquinone biosynthesis C-methylase UbiE